MTRRRVALAAISASRSSPTASISAEWPRARPARWPAPGCRIPADVFCVTRSSAAMAPAKGVHVYVDAVEQAVVRGQSCNPVAIGIAGRRRSATRSDVTDYARRVMERAARRTRFLGFIPRRPARTTRRAPGRCPTSWSFPSAHRAVRAGGAGGAGLRRPGHRLGCGRHP